MNQDSNTLLTQIINYEMLRARTSSADSEAEIALMDSSVQRILRDILATDAGIQKLGELVMATKNMSDELARQSAFEAVYGTGFNQWVETKAITWVKQALGIPNYQSGPLALPKSSVSKAQPDKARVQKNRNTKSLRDRNLYV